MCGCGDGADSSWLYILYSVMQVLHGGQLTVNHAFGLFSEEADENLTVMDDVQMLSAIDRREVEHIWSDQEKCSIKACQYVPSILLQKVD